MNLITFLVGSISVVLFETDALELAPQKFEPLPVGSVVPKGWLLKQLKLQAEGLSGHLSQFWEDIKDSVWIGGTHDSDLHERTPYWLNGVIPLAFLLEAASENVLAGSIGIYKAKRNSELVCKRGLYVSEGGTIRVLNVTTPYDCEYECLKEPRCTSFAVDDCERNTTLCQLKHDEGIAEFSNKTCKCYGQLSNQAVRPINMMSQVERYIEYIISHTQSTGWIGPVVAAGDDHAYWGPQMAILGLCQYAEGVLLTRNDSQLFDNVTDIIKRHLLYQTQQLKKHKLKAWSKARWQDIALSYMWLMDHKDVTSLTQNDYIELYKGIGILHQQGLNWERWFRRLSRKTITTAPIVNYHYVHNVDNAMAIKSSGILYRYTKNEIFASLSKERMLNLDKLLGLPTGMFNGDEWLPIPPTRHPSHGIELCGVVEAMFSYTILFAIHGYVVFADRAERIAYNALPATWASPTGGDMWAHQYIQAVNQINAIHEEDHIWQTDGPESMMYGLEPNFGCCTANFNQGWPKFANMAVFRNNTDGKTHIVVGIYAPMKVTFANNVIVDIATKYPFDDSAKIIVNNPGKEILGISLRIPGRAIRGRVQGKAVENGTFYIDTVHATSVASFFIDFNPEIRVEMWDNGAISFHRGALMYSLNIVANFSITAHHYGTDTMSNDYSAIPIMGTSWNYAVDPSTAIFKVNGEHENGDAPFNHTNWPNTILVTGRKITWKTHKHAAAEPPKSPVLCDVSLIQCGAPETIVLVPHGGTDLRIGLFPTFAASSSNVHLQADQR